VDHREEKDNKCKITIETYLTAKSVEKLRKIELSRSPSIFYILSLERTDEESLMRPSTKNYISFENFS
jgi:hypothetical protein